MPTYEYRCVSCGHLWEAEHSITTPPLSTCPACGAIRDSCQPEWVTAGPVRLISPKGNPANRGFILRGWNDD